MKILKITSSVALSVVLGIAAPAFAGQGHPAEKQDHAQQPAAHQQSKPAQQQHAQQPQQHAQMPRHSNQPWQAPRGQQHTQRTQEQRHVEAASWQQHRTQNWEGDHRSWQQRGGYNGYRIPDYRFRGYFGPSNGFIIGGLPFMEYGGYPRFQYNGYWFSMMDSYPGSWGDDWYDQDDVYVDYVDNGYYLFNRRHPGVGIAINISMSCNPEPDADSCKIASGSFPVHSKSFNSPRPEQMTA